eukprot:Sspe_Gene.36124::Locus_17480_Transcript_2_3_Confidence_0.500_Length_3433::g.36124::m.36124
MGDHPTPPTWSINRYHPPDTLRGSVLLNRLGGGGADRRDDTGLVIDSVVATTGHMALLLNGGRCVAVLDSTAEHRGSAQDDLMSLSRLAASIENMRVARRRPGHVHIVQGHVLCLADPAACPLAATTFYHSQGGGAGGGGGALHLVVVQRTGVVELFDYRRDKCTWSQGAAMCLPLMNGGVVSAATVGGGGTALVYVEVKDRPGGTSVVGAPLLLVRCSPLTQGSAGLSSALIGTVLGSSTAGSDRESQGSWAADSVRWESTGATPAPAVGEAGQVLAQVLSTSGGRPPSRINVFTAPSNSVWVAAEPSVGILLVPLPTADDPVGDGQWQHLHAVNVNTTHMLHALPHSSSSPSMSSTSSSSSSCSTSSSSSSSSSASTPSSGGHSGGGVHHPTGPTLSYIALCHHPVTMELILLTTSYQLLVVGVNPSDRTITLRPLPTVDELKRLKGADIQLIVVNPLVLGIEHNRTMHFIHPSKGEYLGSAPLPDNVTRLTPSQLSLSYLGPCLAVSRSTVYQIFEGARRKDGGDAKAVPSEEEPVPVVDGDIPVIDDPPDLVVGNTQCLKNVQGDDVMVGAQCSKTAQGDDMVSALVTWATASSLRCGLEEKVAELWNPIATSLGERPLHALKPEVRRGGGDATRRKVRVAMPPLMASGDAEELDVSWGIRVRKYTPLTVDRRLWKAIHAIEEANDTMSRILDNPITVPPRPPPDTSLQQLYMNMVQAATIPPLMSYITPHPLWVECAELCLADLGWEDHLPWLRDSAHLLQASYPPKVWEGPEVVVTPPLPIPEAWDLYCERERTVPSVVHRVLAPFFGVVPYTIPLVVLAVAAGVVGDHPEAVWVDLLKWLSGNVATALHQGCSTAPSACNASFDSESEGHPHPRTTSALQLSRGRAVALLLLWSGSTGHAVDAALGSGDVRFVQQLCSSLSEVPVPSGTVPMSDTTHPDRHLLQVMQVVGTKCADFVLSKAKGGWTAVGETTLPEWRTLPEEAVPYLDELTDVGNEGTVTVDITKVWEPCWGAILHSGMEPVHLVHLLSAPDATQESSSASSPPPPPPDTDTTTSVTSEPSKIVSPHCTSLSLSESSPPTYDFPHRPAVPCDIVVNGATQSQTMLDRPLNDLLTAILNHPSL